jgi:hypothetical protein
MPRTLLRTMFITTIRRVKRISKTVPSGALLPRDPYPTSSGLNLLGE